jgi:hypothetical protein
MNNYTYNLLYIVYYKNVELYHSHEKVQTCQ